MPLILWLIYRVFLILKVIFWPTVKNASEIVLHYFATYIQAIVKHDDSFRIA